MRQGRFLLILPAALALAILMAAYLVFLGVSFATQQPGGINAVPPHGLHNYVRYLTSSAALGTLALTISYSIAVSLLVVVIGYPLSYFIVRTERRWLGTMLLGLLVLTFFSGSVTRAYGWLVLLGNKGVLNMLLMGVGLTSSPIRMIYNLTGVSVALV
ncbi:MAG TPA: hypothetical protein VGC14_07740, partial [Rhizobium sp.]